MIILSKLTAQKWKCLFVIFIFEIFFEKEESKRKVGDV